MQTEQKHPLIMGGQGRTADEIQETGAATAAIVVAGMLWGCAMGFSLSALWWFAAAFALISIVATGVAYLLLACLCVEGNGE